MYRNAYEAALAENLRLKQELDRREVEAMNEEMRKRLVEMGLAKKSTRDVKPKRVWR